MTEYGQLTVFFLVPFQDVFTRLLSNGSFDIRVFCNVTYKFSCLKIPISVYSSKYAKA